MKTFQSLCIGAVAAAGLALASPAAARDSHHGHHGGHHSSHHGGHHSNGHHSGHHYSHQGGHHGHYSHYGHGYYGGHHHHSLLSFGLYSRPYYYSSYSDYAYAPRTYAYRGYRVAPSDDLGASVQVALARRGYYRGPIDGILGSGSRRALRAFQSDEGLAVTGRVTASTLDALGIG